MLKKPIRNKSSKLLGYSLLEMAIVLTIVGLLLAGLLPSLNNQLEQHHRNETRQKLADIKEALYGFAINNRYLPCPASQVSGLEDRNLTTAACNQRVGFLPWASLGVSALDGWGRVFRYSASPAFTDASSVFAISSNTDISIRTLNDQALSKANHIPAVIISNGANGLFGTQANGVTVANNASPSGFNVLKQQANISGLSGAGKVFYSADPTIRSDNTDADFDDLVEWISPNILINRMVSAGRLP
jgi:type II secretory pathway pseudopilin PulG